MLKAYSKKYKDRNVLVNKTPFSFNKDGYCAVPDIGNARLDFEQLLKMNHVDEVLDEPVISEEGAREEDTRKGIDAVVLAPEPEELEELEELEEALEEEAEEEAEEALEEETLDEEDELEEDDESEDSED